MFRNRILKILALLMVLNILIIPLTSFTPQQQNKYKVYAAEGIVDIRFYNAVLSMIGITAAGLAYMSPSFSMPEVDMIQLKEQFAQTLEADAAKKSAWIQAQTDYLAGGVSKTMGAVELAKIGVNDIYNQFINYLKTKFPDNASYNAQCIDYGYTFVKNYGEFELVVLALSNNNYVQYLTKFNTYTKNTAYGIDFYLSKELLTNANTSSVIGDLKIFDKSTNALVDGYCSISLNAGKLSFGVNPVNYTGDISRRYWEVYFNSIGVFSNLTTNQNCIGNVNYNSGDIINSTVTDRSIYPTIPWIDTTVPIGTIVTPAIAAPYAGAVPIDVPITSPIDPPIDVPVNPPADTTLIGTVAAILAGLTPITGFLEYILAGQVSLTDAIEAGITGVIDGIGDIAGTLTGGITSSLTDIQTSIGSLLDPPTETLDLDKLKNINSVLFTKFPFSIPFDFIAIVTAINADPVAPVLTIPFNMQDFGGSNSNVEIDLSIYDNFANIARQIVFIGFVIFMLFNTRKLIWK